MTAPLVERIEAIIETILKDSYNTRRKEMAAAEILDLLQTEKPVQEHINPDCGSFRGLPCDCPRTEMKKKSAQEKLPEQSMEERFEAEFGNLTLGILSGDKKSPVFVNNELEVPRLKHFITAEVQKAEERVRKELNVFTRPGQTPQDFIEDGIAFERQRIVAIVEGMPRSWRSHHDLNREEVLRSIQEPKE